MSEENEELVRFGYEWFNREKEPPPTWLPNGEFINSDLSLQMLLHDTDPGLTTWPPPATQWESPYRRGDGLEAEGERIEAELARVEREEGLGDERQGPR